MRKFSRYAILLFLPAAIISVTLAGGTPVDLPGGETVMLMEPGVDGVEPPWAVQSRMVAPLYPDRAGVPGGGNEVAVAVLVLADGSVAQVEVLGARHPNLGYEEEARNAVSRWTFRPARRNGEPVNSYLIYNIEFPERNPLRGIGGFDDFLYVRGLGGGAGTATPGQAGSAGGTSTLAFGNGARVSIASRPPFITGQITDKNNSGKYIGTTDWAAQNGR